MKNYLNKSFQDIYHTIELLLRKWHNQEEMQKTQKAILTLLIVAVLSAIVFIVSLLLVEKAYLAYQYYKFPLKYEEYIKKYSQEFDLDPYLVAAVIYEESRFRSGSNSNKGAVGLMQILPETGAYIAGKLDFPEHNDSKLLESETNIRYGCFYLRYLKEKYNSLDQVLAAYNAGEGNVNNWINGESLDIKYKETTDFVNKVKETKLQYEKLYMGTGRL